MGVWQLSVEPILCGETRDSASRASHEWGLTQRKNERETYCSTMFVTECSGRDLGGDGGWMVDGVSAVCS